MTTARQLYLHELISYHQRILQKWQRIHANPPRTRLRNFLDAAQVLLTPQQLLSGVGKTWEQK